MTVSEIDQGLPGVTGDAETDKAALKSGFVAVLRSRDIWMMGLAALFLGMVEFAALAHLVLFLNSDWGFSVAVAAGMLAFCEFGGALGKPLSGLVSDRLLRRRRVPALLGMGVLAGLSCVALAVVQPGNTVALWGMLFLLGFGAVGWGGLMGTLAGETGGHSAAGAAAGVSAAFFNVGIFFGPPLFGFIVDATGAYPPAWWALAPPRQWRWSCSCSCARAAVCLSPRPLVAPSRPRVSALSPWPTRARSPSGGRRRAWRR